MATKEDLLAGLMERLNDPTLTGQEFDEIQSRIKKVQQISE